MDSKSTGCLCTLGILTGLVCLAVRSCDDRESISYYDETLHATLIKSTIENDKTYYFIDTDKDLKTAEYALFTQIGTTQDIQLKAKILNHSSSPFQMELNQWRKHATLFERVRN